MGSVAVILCWWLWLLQSRDAIRIASPAPHHPDRDDDRLLRRARPVARVPELLWQLAWALIEFWLSRAKRIRRWWG
jgi:hypothetical protein